MAGGIIALASGRSGAWVFVAFPLTYWWFMSKPPSQLPRWVYPITPFVAVMGSTTMWTLRDWIARRWQSMPIASRYLRPLPTVAVLTVTLVPILWTATIEFSRRLTPSTFERTIQWIEERTSPGNVVLVEEGWLDFEGATVQVRRVPRLRNVLSGGRYQLFANDWIVVPEPDFDKLDVRRLTLVQEISIEIGFKGNQGFDFRIYSSPKPVTIRPPVDVHLGTDAALPFLGLDWRAAADGAGLPVPAGGGSVFLPPVASDSFHIWLEVAAPQFVVRGTQDVPIEVTLDGVPMSMERVGETDAGVRLVSGPISDAGSGITEIRITRVASLAQATFGSERWQSVDQEGGAMTTSGRPNVPWVWDRHWRDLSNRGAVFGRLASAFRWVFLVSAVRLTPNAFSRRTVCSSRPVAARQSLQWASAAKGAV